jgi:hypothetical protein
MPAKHKRVRTAMHGGWGGVFISSHSRLTMPCCQSLLNERSSRSAGDATDGEADPTCRVSSSGNNITHQAVRACQPLRNRSWAPRRRDATPSERYCRLDCSECNNCHSIPFNSRKKYRSQGASESTSHPKAMLWSVCWVSTDLSRPSSSQQCCWSRFRYHLALTRSTNQWFVQVSLLSLLCFECCKVCLFSVVQLHTGNWKLWQITTHRSRNRNCRVALRAVTVGRLYLQLLCISQVCYYAV